MASDAAASPPTASTTTRIRVEKALSALLKWKESQSNNKKPQLLPQDNFVYLNLSLKKIPPKPRTNPFKIALPHTILEPSSELCLIVDDRSKSNLTKDTAKKIIKSQDLQIGKVLSLSKLKTNYKPFEAKRKLSDSYHMFFADKRILPLLPKLLGKHFFGKKKLPLPIDLTHKNWKEQIDRACSSAFLFMKSGTCCVVKVGKVSMETEEIVDNVVAAIDGIVKVVPRKWAGVRSLHLKLSDSLALPIYQALPDIKLKIQGIKECEQGIRQEDGGELVLVEDKNRKSEELRKQGKKKGRIHEVRYMDACVGEDDLASDDDDEDEDDYEIEMNKDDQLGGAEFVDKKMTEVDLVQGQADNDESESEKGANDDMGTAELECAKKGLMERKVPNYSNGTEWVEKMGKVEKRESKKQRTGKLFLKDGRKFVKKKGDNGDLGTQSKNGKTKVNNKKSMMK